MVGQEFEVERQKRRLMTVVVHPAWFWSIGPCPCLIRRLTLPDSTFCPSITKNNNVITVYCQCPRPHHGLYTVVHSFPSESSIVWLESIVGYTVKRTGSSEAQTIATKQGISNNIQGFILAIQNRELATTYRVSFLPFNPNHPGCCAVQTIRKKKATVSK